MKKSNKTETKLKFKDATGNIQDLVRNKILVLKHIRQKVQKNLLINKLKFYFCNLFPLVYDTDILMLSYNNIKLNEGSITPGVDSNTAGLIFRKRILILSQKIKSGLYKFPSVKKKSIPKPIKKIKWNKKNVLKHGRPLGMSDFDSKLVQEAIRLILDAIYEPIFEYHKVSFGFRQGLGYQNALFTVRPQTQGMDYVIEGEIESPFNNLDYDILKNKLKIHINDDKFIDFVILCCKAGIFDELQNSIVDPLSGVPQGGIVSPLLWNIYMHNFDEFILNGIQNTYNIINKKQNRFPTNYSPNSKLYKNRLYARTITRKKLEKITNNKKIKEIQDTCQKKIAIQLKIKLQHFNKLVLRTKSKNRAQVRLRFHYIRYADVWLFFTNAKLPLVNLIKNKVSSYLKDYLKLTLSQKKTKITNLYKDKVRFLGYTIFKLIHSKISKTRFRGLKRTTNNKINIGINKDNALSKLLLKGYMDKKSKPREQPALSTMGTYEIVMIYNSMIRGYINYYVPIIDNRSDINYFVYILEYSCYKTLCQKYRTTINKLLKKHGNPLTAIFEEKKESTQKNPTKQLDNNFLNLDNLTNIGFNKQLSLLTSKIYWEETEPTVMKIKNNIKNNKKDQEFIVNGNFINYSTSLPKNQV